MCLFLIIPQKLILLFLILGKLLGQKNMTVINKDIEDGLQNVLIGDSKYSDATIKMKVFFQRLEESRKGIFT